MSKVNPIIAETLAPFEPFKPKKVKSWEQKIAGMVVKCEVWQNAPAIFEVACFRLGSSIPVLYQFPTLDQACGRYESFMQASRGESEVMVRMQSELEMLRDLCASAQCWLDAAGYMAKNHATKCELQKNADSFRQAYAKITS